MATYLEEAPEEWDEESHGSPALAAEAQGTESNAKDDTIFYARDDGAGISDLAVDLSQYADDLVTNATWVHELQANANRFNVSEPFAVEFDVTLNNLDTGYLFGGGVSQRWSMRVGEAAGLVRVRMGIGGINTTIASLTLPGVDAGDERFKIGWRAIPNPYTTGASDAVLHLLYAFNVTDGSYAQITATSAVRDTGAAPFTIWAQTTAGGTPFTGTPHAARISAGRPRTVTETREDFVAQTPIPILQLATRCEFPIVDPACTLGAAGQLVGPVHFMGAQAVKANALRTFSPIVNEHYLNRPEFVGSTLAVLPTQWRRAAPDADYTLLGSFLFYRPVPPSANRLRARVFVKEWQSGLGTLSSLAFRVYSMNRPPVSADVVDQAAAFIATQANAMLAATDHGSGGTDGEWLDFGIWAPSVNSDGCTWLALAVDVVGGTASVTRFEIGALVIEPGVLE